MRVYNLLGRRDNNYKARIKITTHEHGIGCDNSAAVEEQFAETWETSVCGDADLRVFPRLLSVHLEPPKFNPQRAMRRYATAHGLSRLAGHEYRAHKAPGYAIVICELQTPGGIPGDASAAQMRAVADIARPFCVMTNSASSHEQNLILPHVHAQTSSPKSGSAAGRRTWRRQYRALIRHHRLPGHGLLRLGHCALHSGGPADRDTLSALKLEHDIGQLKLKISGCINACGHHHVGHIGILGLEKAGVESYQITLGGDAGADAEIGTRAGPGFRRR